MNNTETTTASITTAPSIDKCTKCGSYVVLNSQGTYSTGNSHGWIMPDHRNTTCDGIHLHSQNER